MVALPYPLLKVLQVGGATCQKVGMKGLKLSAILVREEVRGVT